MSTCPTCGGSQLAGHPAGWLAWEHRATCPIRDAEDATHVNDRDILSSMKPPNQAGHFFRDGYNRPATPAEHTLLATLGHTPPEPLTTNIYPAAGSGTLRRTWPQLDPNAHDRDPTHWGIPVGTPLTR